MDVPTSFLVAKDVDEAFDARFKAGGVGLSIDREAEHGLSFDAADDSVVGHGIGAAGEGADKQDAVNAVMQVHDRADDFSVHDPGQGI